MNTATENAVIQPTMRDTRKCLSCPADVLDARHETNGTVNPLTREGVGMDKVKREGNCVVWKVGDSWFYRTIAALERPDYAAQGYRFYVSHFADCPQRKQFRKK